MSAEVPLPTGCGTTSDLAPPLGVRDEERSADTPLPSGRHAGFDFAPPFSARYEERSGDAPFPTRRDASCTLRCRLASATRSTTPRRRCQPMPL